MDEELLQGGISNADAVVRVGGHVLRPSSRYSGSIHRWLIGIRDAGFDGVPVPIGIDPDGRERLEFIEGDVPIPPYPSWARSDSALVSIVELMARFHRASANVDPSRQEWNSDAADPEGGAFVCHNDVCLENVVFRHGRAMALIDFDLAAPGRPLFDLAAFARMTVPIDDPTSATRLGWTTDADPRDRLRLIADTYGLSRQERILLIRLIGEAVDWHGRFVARRVKARDPGYVTMWTEMGGQARLDRRGQWWADHRRVLQQALLDTMPAS